MVLCIYGVYADLGCGFLKLDTLERKKQTITFGTKFCETKVLIKLLSLVIDGIYNHSVNRNIMTHSKCSINCIG